MSLDVLNFVDYIVLVVLVISGLLATLRGFTRELMGLIGWGAAVVAARLLEPTMISFIEEYIIEDDVQKIMGWSLPFVAVAFAWFVFANIVSPGLNKVTLGNMDRILGFFFGAARGIVVVALLYVGVIAATESEESFSQPVLDSAFIAPVRIVATIMTGYAPDDIREHIQKAIPSQDLDDIKDGFSDQAGEQLDNAQDATEDYIEDAEDGDLYIDEQNFLRRKSN